MIISFWAVFAASVISSLVGVIGGIFFVFRGKAVFGCALFAASLALAGLAIFVLIGTKALTRVALKLTKRLSLGAIKLFKRRYI